MVEAVVMFTLDRLVRLACDVLEASVGVTGLAEPDGRLLVITHGLPEDEGPGCTESLNGVILAVVSSGRPFVVNDSESYLALDWDFGSAVPGVRALAGVPVLGLDRDVIGSLWVMDRRVHDWNDHELAVLARFAEVMADEVAAPGLRAPAEVLPVGL
ncbi:MAG: GAF domain-containing protein [Acidimicrobiales bacterium]